MIKADAIGNLIHQIAVGVCGCFFQNLLVPCVIVRINQVLRIRRQLPVGRRRIQLCVCFQNGSESDAVGIVLVSRSAATGQRARTVGFRHRLIHPALQVVGKRLI